ncbi:hypothetical protein WDU94_005973 [Cyamophila willieti]
MFLFKYIQDSSAIRLKDITTVYEINTLQSDMEDVKYLNTCTVSVHVPAEDAQLPLFNMDSNNNWIPERNIPPLYSRPTLTKWKRLDGSDILNSYIEQQMLNKTCTFNMNLPPLGHLMVQTYFNDIHVVDSGSVFNESYMNLYNKNNDALPFNTLMLIFIKSEYTRTQLYWDTNDNNFIEITTRNGNNLTVCYYNERTECKEFKFSFTDGQNNNAPRLLIPLYGELVISDLHSPQIFQTNFYLPKGFTRYTRVNHIHDGIWSVIYNLFQAKPTHIASPWLEMKTNTAIFIFYFAQPGHTMKVSLEDETSKAIVQLPGHELDRVIQTAELERVLAKVNIPSWTGKKRIRIDGDNIVLGNIWESTELDQYKIEGPKSCIKSNRMEIYNTLERSGGTREPVDNCFNGGRLKNATCICPPGFTGTQCELPCGRNTFGQKCSSVCSNDCKGTILCTPDYGCTCAPGYYGDKCVELK